ncbi:MAG: NADH-quinone oxidoreductase subunit A [Ilumatobacteraceae bacterium]
MGQYLPIFVLLLLAALFGALSSVMSMLLAPRRPNSAKSAPYECGIVPSREAPERFPVSFYIVAMLFIMFDIEIIFAYPYAVSRQELGSFAFFEMAAFSLVFFIAFLYAIARGALDWGPIQQTTRLDQKGGNDISLAMTKPTYGVRTVGLDGRMNEASV